MAAKFPLGAMLTHLSFHTISFFAPIIFSRYNIFKSMSQMVFLRCNMIAYFQTRIDIADCRHARCTGNKFSCDLRVVSYLLDSPPILNRGISLSSFTKVYRLRNSNRQSWFLRQSQKSTQTSRDSTKTVVHSTKVKFEPTGHNRHQQLLLSVK